MIEVILSVAGTREACVFDIDTPERAVFAARTLWDDYRRENERQGVSRTMTTAFIVDGSVVRTIEGKRP